MESKRFDLKHSMSIESFGVTVAVCTNDSRIMNDLNRRIVDLLAGKFKIHKKNKVSSHQLHLIRTQKSRFELFKNGALLESDLLRRNAFARLLSNLRLTVAENAVDKVFVHAGAVSWKGRGIVIPARSNKGKSTLTAALVRLGAVYYSDEYAILDRNGLLHPFAKALSLRGIVDKFAQTDVPVESIGGRSGNRAIPIGLVIATEYKKGARWRPKNIKSGPGMLTLIDNAVAIRRAPEFVLPVFSKAAVTARFVRSARGEADETARLVLDLVEQLDNE